MFYFAKPNLYIHSFLFYVKLKSYLIIFSSKNFQIHLNIYYIDIFAADLYSTFIFHLYYIPQNFITRKYRNQKLNNIENIINIKSTIITRKLILTHILKFRYR